MRKLKKQLFDPSSSDPDGYKRSLQPDIDMLLSSEDSLQQKLIGVEVKVIYMTSKGKLNASFYRGLDQALALLRFGLDGVRFFQVFIIAHDKERREEENRKNIELLTQKFSEYALPMGDIIKTLNLPISYTPSWDIVEDGQLSSEPLQVLGSKDSDGALQEEPFIQTYKGKNPFLDSSHQFPMVIRGFLLETYSLKHRGNNGISFGS